MLTQVPGTTIVGHAACAKRCDSRHPRDAPDLVVLDVQLAEGSGFDVLRALHAQAPELEVVMLSNYSAEPYRQIAAALWRAGRFFDKAREFERVRDMVAQRAAHQTTKGARPCTPSSHSNRRASS